MGEPEEVPEERKFSFVYIPVDPCVPGRPPPAPERPYLIAGQHGMH